MTIDVSFWDLGGQVPPSPPCSAATVAIQLCNGEWTISQFFVASTGKYESKYRPELVQHFDFIKENSIKDNPVQVIDSRPAGRFKGIAPEPNPAIPSGHIAKTTNIPFFELLDSEKKIMKEPGQILEVFKANNINLDNEVIAMCGAGIQASTTALGIYFAKGKDISLYDGSWAEWATKVPELIITEKKD